MAFEYVVALLAITVLGLRFKEASYISPLAIAAYVIYVSADIFAFVAAIITVADFLLTLVKEIAG